MTTGYEGYQDAPAEEDLGRLAELAKEQFAAEQEVARCEKALKAAKKKFADIAEGQIPDLMAKIDVKEFSTASGLRIKIRRIIRASVPVANRARAYKWLDTHGQSGMIKRSVIVGFNREEQKAAEALLKRLRPKFENVRQEQKVESATLRGFIREQIDAGKKVPMELFGAAEVRVAKIETT